MGCASSKVDDLPAVVLCRDRVDLVKQALQERYSLSESHLAYILSLKSVGISLNHFFHSASTLPPPIVTKTPSSGHLSDSSDDSFHHGAGVGGGGDGHIHFHSDSDSEHGGGGGGGHIIDDSGSESDTERKRVVPEVLYTGVVDDKPYDSSSYSYPYSDPYPYMSNGNGNGNGMHMNYMKRHVTQSVSYEQRPVSAETIRFENGSTSSSSQYYYPNQPNYGSSNGNPYGFMGYGGGGGDGGVATSKKVVEVVPPPPPPATSTWDFLNPFESIESSYPPYTPSSRDSREVREEEGIPELEDEEFDHEVVKEVVHGHKKVVEKESLVMKPSSSSGGGGERKSNVESIESVSDLEEEEEVVRSLRTSGADKREVFEVDMVDKKVVRDDQRKGGGSGVGGGGGGFKGVFEVGKELQAQFERAASCGDQLTKVLEVGKLRYQRKNPAFQVSTKMLKGITPSLPSTSNNSEVSLNVDEEMQLRTLNLSASLQKLCLWEKKLYDEVKAEEKMRVAHDRKVRKLKHMEERGAEPQKIETMKSVVRGLSTKISIAIQIVDRISDKINKVRDEELWPLLNELIKGLSRMWKDMHECHRNQCEAIDLARGLDALAFPSNPTDTHLEATLQLEQDLINWTGRFTEWVGAQKRYVRALNCWLFKCLLYEPEETADGVPPYSPGRAGAPPIFVICNQWNQSMERISETSEKEVINSMGVFAVMIWRFRERDKGEMKQRMTANRDIERKFKTLEREDVKMQKEIQALDKKLELTSGGPSDGGPISDHVVYAGDTSNKSSLQTGLRHIFEALERFTADSVKAYEELLECTEEVVRQHGTAS